MIQRKFILRILFAVGLSCTIQAAAVENNSLIGIGLFPPVQIPSSEFGITGLRVTAPSIRVEP